LRYQGSKRRVVKLLYPAILKDLGREPDRIIEPFIGGANFTSGIISAGFSGEIIAGDLDPDCNFMWQKVLEGWLPTLEQELTREEYNAIRAGDFTEDPLRGFARTVCAFSGQPWGGWVDTTKYNLWKSGVSSLSKQQKVLRSANIQVIGGSYDQYEEFITDDSIFYFDPPYSNTTGYGKSSFDTDRMWKYAEELSQQCPVYVSELTAPEGWELVTELDFLHHGNKEHRKVVTEKLFRKSSESF
jgi:site-specific DNA-adenine methylase